MLITTCRLHCATCSGVEFLPEVCSMSIGIKMEGRDHGTFLYPDPVVPARARALRTLRKPHCACSGYCG